MYLCSHLSVQRWWFLCTLAVATTSSGAASSTGAFPSSSATLLKVTPSATSTTTLYNNQALTLVFSGPVIALGQDASGDAAKTAATVPFVLAPSSGPSPSAFLTSRWVSTSVFRADPPTGSNAEGGGWPTDLKFSLNLRDPLLTHAGAKVEPAASVGRKFSYQTGRLRQSQTSVASKRASSLTQGRWTSALTHREREGLTTIKAVYPAPHECPPDAVVKLCFSYPVDPSLLQGSLVLFSVDKGEVTGTSVKVSAPRGDLAALAAVAAPGGSAAGSAQLGNCVVVTPNLPKTLPDADTATAYTLRLKKGVRYHPLAGSTQQDYDTVLTGLLPFKFQGAFPRSSASKNSVVDVRHVHFDLYLRHGLAAPTAPTLAALQTSAVSIKGLPVLAVATTPDIATLRLTVPASVAPSASYALNVAANSGVVDGFGLPLHAGTVPFVTAAVPSFMQTASWPRPVVLYSSFTGK